MLPKGEWIKQPSALFGYAGNVYFAVYLSHGYELLERPDYLEVISAGMPGGVVVEALSVSQAAELGISGLDEFAAAAAQRAPKFGAGEILSAEYSSLISKAHLQLSTDNGLTEVKAEINSKPVSFDSYSV